MAMSKMFWIFRPKENPTHPNSWQPTAVNEVKDESKANIIIEEVTKVQRKIINYIKSALRVENSNGNNFNRFYLLGIASMTGYAIGAIRGGQIRRFYYCSLFAIASAIFTWPEKKREQLFKHLDKKVSSSLQSDLLLSVSKMEVMKESKGINSNNGMVAEEKLESDKNPKMVTESKLISIAEAAWDATVDLAFSEDWQTIHVDHGLRAEIQSKSIANGRRVYRLRAVISLESELLVELLRDGSKFSEWNETVKISRVLKQLTPKVELSYQVTKSNGPGGFIGSRDFITVIKNDFLKRSNNKVFVQAGCSVHQLPPNINFEPHKNCVRAWNGPNGQIIRPLTGDDGASVSEFVLIMDCDFKGWLPASVIDYAMPQACLDYLKCVRKLASKNEQNKEN